MKPVPTFLDQSQHRLDYNLTDGIQSRAMSYNPALLEYKRRGGFADASTAQTAGTNRVNVMMVSLSGMGMVRKQALICQKQDFTETVTLSLQRLP